MRKAINFRSYEDLLRTIRSSFSKFKNDYDIIVGIPRSGMIPSYIIGLILNKPVISLNEYLEDINPLVGFRIEGHKIKSVQEAKNVLIVDDSINSGAALSRCKNMLIERVHKDRFTFLSVYATKDSSTLVDIYLEIVHNPRIFEWNILHSWVYSYACVDLDGVLCSDPTEDENDDGERYRNFILNAPPKFIPSHSIKYIVTSRLAKYRQETELWLNKRGIRYEQLVMLENVTAEERRRLGLHPVFKSDFYGTKANGVLIFIESSLNQAKEINKRTKLPVFSVEGFKFFDVINSDNFFNRSKRKSKKLVKTIFKKMFPNYKLKRNKN